MKIGLHDGISAGPTTNGRVQLDLGLRTPARPLRLSRDLAGVPLERYRLQKTDGRKWKSIARERMALAEWLAVHGDGDGSRIFPSERSMTRHFGWSRRKTFYLLADLKELGLLSSEGLTSERGTRKRRMNLTAFLGLPLQTNIALLQRDSGPGVQSSDALAGVQSNDAHNRHAHTDTKIETSAAQIAASSPRTIFSGSQPKTQSQAYINVRNMIPEAIRILCHGKRLWADADCREELKQWAARNGIEYGRGDAVDKAFTVAEARVRDGCLEEKRVG